MAATLLGLRIGGSECVRTFLYTSRGCRSCGANQAERQRVSRQLASLVNTFTNYGDVKRALTKNSERVREVTLRKSSFRGCRALITTVSYQLSATGDWLPPFRQGLVIRAGLVRCCQQNE